MRRIIAAILDESNAYRFESPNPKDLMRHQEFAEDEEEGEQPG